MPLVQSSLVQRCSGQCHGMDSSLYMPSSEQPSPPQVMSGTRAMSATTFTSRFDSVGAELTVRAEVLSSRLGHGAVISIFEG